VRVHIRITVCRYGKRVYARWRARTGVTAVETQGRMLVTREITVTRTMKKSKMLNQLLQKGQKRCAIMVKVSSTAKMIVKVVSSTIKSSSGPLRTSRCAMDTVGSQQGPRRLSAGRHNLTGYPFEGDIKNHESPKPPKVSRTGWILNFLAKSNFEITQRSNRCKDER